MALPGMTFLSKTGRWLQDWGNGAINTVKKDWRTMSSGELNSISDLFAKPKTQAQSGRLTETIDFKKPEVQKVSEQKQIQKKQVGLPSKPTQKLTAEQTRKRQSLFQPTQADIAQRATGRQIELQKQEEAKPRSLIKRISSFDAWSKMQSQEDVERDFLNTQRKIAERKGVEFSSENEKRLKELTFNKISDLTFAFEAGTKNVGKEAVRKAEEVIGKKLSKDEAKNLASKAEEILKKKERGFVTSVKEEFPELNKVAGQYVPKKNDVLMQKASNLIKDDLDFAERMAVSGISDDAVATGAKLLEHYDGLIKGSTDQATKNALQDKAAALANSMAKNLTEAGRTVQAASLLGKLTPEGQLRFAAREIQKYNDMVEKSRGVFAGLKKKIPELGGKQADEILGMMKEIEGMPEGIDKARKFQEVQEYISALVPSPLMKKISTVWKAGLLTGIKTSGVNIFSNLSHAGAEIAKDIPASMVDKMVSLVTKERTITPTLKGAGKGSLEGAKRGFDYLKTGFDERDIGTKLDFKRINFGKGKIAKGLQKYSDTVFRVLGAEDQPFYYSAKTRSFYEQAKAQAITKKLKGKEAQKFIDNLIENPTEKMIKNATYDAEMAVFQNKTALGTAASAIQKIPGAEFIVPFGKTPSAVATQIINYSPLGVPKTILENLGKGKFDQRLFSKGIGRSITGTAALAIGYELFKKGFVNLAYPTTEREQKLWEAEGRKPNTIYDPISKKWRSISVLGPLGNLLLIGGSFQKEFENSGSPSEAFAKALAGSAKSFTEQTFLKGVNAFLAAINDPDRSAASFTSNLLSSVIPTIVSDVAKATDTKERRAATILEKLQARIPGLREKLEPQVTVLGEEIERVGNPLEVMIDPTRPSKEKSSPVISEIRRLWDSGFKVAPTLLGDKKGYPGLSPQENTELWKRAGELTNDKLSKLIELPKYQELSDEDRAKLVEDFVDKSKLYARAEVVLKKTEGLEGEELLKKLKELKESKLMTNDVFKAYQELR